jgi:hypothetical protein
MLVYRQNFGKTLKGGVHQGEGLNAQAAVGAHSYVGAMQAVYWTVHLGNGKTSSGAAFPFSSTWSGQKVHRYNSAGLYTTMLSGYAISGKKVLQFLCPISTVYVY